jgi:flagellar biosynthesis chaperone FliJ
MKQGYLEQLKEAEHSQDDLQQSTQLRRFMGQLDLTTRAITDQMADLQRQQQTIAARFRELNRERIKFETLADRARTQLKQTTQKKEQKDSDALSAQRFAIKLNQRPSS